MDLARIASRIDDLGSKAYVDGRRGLEMFFATLGATLASSIFRAGDQDREAVWIFDMAPAAMYEQIKQQLSQLPSGDRADAIEALRGLVEEEQSIQKQTPEQAVMIRRVLDQIEQELAGS